MVRTDLSVHRERAILVGVLLPHSKADPRDPLGELRSLAKTAGALVVDHVLQKRDKIDPLHVIGKGKVHETAQRVRDNSANVVIFDSDLTPAQVRSVEETVECKVVDRSELILDIFATRARTHQARIQVELAQLEYTAPRLRGMWSHLERIAGAAGGTGAGKVGGIGTRGPGERQIEIDRRIVQKRVSHLRKELASIDRRKVRQVQTRSSQFNLALVGYTNAGKSSLLNALTGASVLVEDKLFATLDTKTRKWSLGLGERAVISDTVGFVRDLPHHLVASFRATLEEVIHANLLLHVVDASSPVADLQYQAVRSVLDELGCKDKPQLTLLNKIDVLDQDSILPVVQAMASDPIRISAKTGQGLDLLIERVRREIQADRLHRLIQTSAGNGKLLAFLAAETEIIDQTFDDGQVRIEFHICQRKLPLLQEFNAAFQQLEPRPDDNPNASG